MSCRDGGPHSIGCPCWNEKVRLNVYEQCARVAEGAYPDDHRFDCEADREAAKDAADYVACLIRQLAEKHRLEAGEAELRDK